MGSTYNSSTKRSKEREITCLRCGFTLPDAEFPLRKEGNRLNTCNECAPATGIIIKVAGIAAHNLLAVRGARALLKMGYVQAAIVMLETGFWPDLRQARALQRRAA